MLQGNLGDIKARYGKRNVQIDYEGDISFLRSSALIDACNDYGKQVEVRLKPTTDSQDLLREKLSSPSPPSRSDGGEGRGEGAT